jgi:hypothetical protein
MKTDCEICGGSGKIRLPVRQKMQPQIDVSQASSPIREYSCPECSYKIPQERILIAQCEEILPDETLIKDSDYLDHSKRHMIHKIGDFLFRENHIKFTKILEPSMYGRSQYRLRAIVGIISQRFIAKFEDRVKEHQWVIARQVADDAIVRIRNWMSYYNYPDITKDEAIKSILDALREVVK